MKYPIHYLSDASHHRITQGFVLLDLIFSIALTSFALVMILGFWRMYHHHIVTQSRKGILQQETRVITKLVLSQMQRSPGILSWHEHGICFNESSAKDTIAYEFYSNQLQKNGVPIPLISQKAYVSEFLFKKADETPTETTEELLLSLTIALADSFSNHDTVVSLIAVHCASSSTSSNDEWK